jgi:predicted DNA-binding protein
METVTLKLDRRHIQRLKDHAEATGRSQAAVIRDLIDRYLNKVPRRSLHDQAKDLCGSVSGPKDMSVRKLKVYGRD